MKERGPGGTPRVDEQHGDDDTTAGTGTDSAELNSQTFHKRGGSPGSLQGGTAVGNDDVDARERAGVGCLP